MKELIIIGIIFFIFMGIGDYLLRKKLNVSKSGKMSPGAQRFEHIVVGIICFSYIFIGVSLISRNEEINILVSIVPFFIIVSAFRAFMEWKYNRKAKIWAMEIYSIFAYTAIVFILLVVGEKWFG